MFRAFLATLKNDELRLVLRTMTGRGLKLALLLESFAAINDCVKSLALYERFLKSDSDADALP